MNKPIPQPLSKENRNFKRSCIIKPAKQFDVGIELLIDRSELFYSDSTGFIKGEYDV